MYPPYFYTGDLVSAINVVAIVVIVANLIVWFGALLCWIESKK